MQPPQRDIHISPKMATQAMSLEVNARLQQVLSDLSALVLKCPSPSLGKQFPGLIATGSHHPLFRLNYPPSLG